MDENRCVKCGSTQTRVRIGSQERVCSHCGAIVPINNIQEAKREVVEW